MIGPNRLTRTRHAATTAAIMLGFLPGLAFAMESASSSVVPALVPSSVATDEAASEASIAADLRFADSLSRAFEHAAKRAERAVVHITSEAEIQRYRQDMFGRRFRVGSPELRPNGLGSGVVINADRGLVLTNHHVIKNGDRLVVRLHDGREVEAETVGSDESTDIAVLRIDAEDLVAAPMADSDALRVGEWVLAMGSPFGFDSTVTAGIVSAKGRSLDRGMVAQPSNQEFIQTDAAINPGNSGGPLINLAGEIVGINTAIISSTRQSAGLGFAIPSQVAKSVADSIVKFGRVRRGYLGVRMRDLTPEQRRAIRLAPDQGVEVEFVQPDSPAANAGLIAGDVILKIDGREVVGGLNRLLNLISLSSPGSVIEIEVLRNSQPVVVRATVADSTEARAAELMGESLYELGVIVRATTREISRELGYRQHVPGVLVLDVQQGTPAAEAGLEVGDILTGVDGLKITDAVELREKLEGSLERSVVELVRGRMRGTVEVRLD